MRVLFVSALFPYPLQSGGHVRSYNLLKQLHHDHDITLVAFVRGEEGARYRGELSFCSDINLIRRGSGWNPRYIARSLMTNKPMLPVTYDVRPGRSQIRKLLRETSFDVIHLEPSYTLPIIPQTRVPIVASEHNIEYDVYRKNAGTASFLTRPLLAYDAWKLKQWERTMWRRVDHITSVSSEDATVIHDSAGDTPVTIIPNSVDIDMFSYKRRTIKEADLRCLFVGNFKWVQNTDAVSYIIQSIWPVLHARWPHATLSIVGRDLPQSLQERIRRTQGVTYKGYVDDILHAYHTHSALLSPIRVGGGSRYKMVEALATGLPILTNDMGIEGLGSVARSVVWIADSAQDYIAQIQDIIDHPTSVTKKTKKGRTLVENEYTWASSAKKLDAVWRSIHG